MTLLYNDILTNKTLILNPFVSKRLNVIMYDKAFPKVTKTCGQVMTVFFFCFCLTIDNFIIVLIVHVVILVETECKLVL